MPAPMPVTPGYVDLSRQGLDGKYLPCRTWRTPKTYAEYVSQFPKCVSTTWIETLPGEAKEKQARVEYALLNKQVAVMKACHEPGHKPLFTASTVPEGLDLYAEVARLKAEHKRLLKAIEGRELCTDARFQATTQGYFDEPASAEGAAFPELYLATLSDHTTKRPDRPWSVEDTHVVHREYETRAGQQHPGKDPWVSLPPVPAPPSFDLGLPDGKGSYAACPLDRTYDNYLEYALHYPRCVGERALARLLAQPEAVKLARYAVLVKQVNVMARCRIPGDPPVFVPMTPRKGANLDQELAKLESQHADLVERIRAGRCGKRRFKARPIAPTTLP